MNSRYSYLIPILGEELFHKINSAKILVIGAGGIGCELLKNLVMIGVEKIDVIDLDTIDVSNLNRQFLFRKENVGQSKAEVACAVVSKFNPLCKIKAHHGNVKSPEFDYYFYKQFDLVINALDNVEARSHVNMMCIATNIPLIESGTTGYFGQVSVIKGRETECYSCQPKPIPKNYPICTIRSTPEKIVHCIVWAKELLSLLFGNKTNSMLYEENYEDSVFMKDVEPSENDVKNDESLIKYVKRLMNSLFCKEIEKKISMDLYKGLLQQPIILNDLESIKMNMEEINGYKVNKYKVLELNDYLKLFISSYIKIRKEYKNLIGTMVFDKDRQLDVEFITAASNIRAFIFHIPFETLFKTQEIAGNIISAISTTNAMASAIEISEVINIFKNNNNNIINNSHYTYIRKLPTRKGNIILPTELQLPNVSCSVCNMNYAVLKMDTKKAHLLGFLDLIKNELKIESPNIYIGNNCVYDDNDKEDYNTKTNLCNLSGGGINDKSIICVYDNDSFKRCTIFVYHEDVDKIDCDKYENGYIFEGEIRELIEPPNMDENNDENNNNDDDDLDCYEIVKRKRDDNNNENEKRKKEDIKKIKIDDVVDLD